MPVEDLDTIPWVSVILFAKDLREKINNISLTVLQNKKKREKSVLMDSDEQHRTIFGSSLEVLLQMWSNPALRSSVNLTHHCDEATDTRESKESWCFYLRDLSVISWIS